MMQTMAWRIVAVLMALVVHIAVPAAWAADTVTIEREGQVQKITGKILVEALDGGLLLLADDGTQWMIQPDEIQERLSDEQPFKPLDSNEIKARLLAEMPAGFRIHQTAHYTICYNTSQAYARWCGELYERLYRAFFNYWKHRGWELEDPEFPLIALVFDTRDSFANYARPELGQGVDTIIGYYNMRTNRVNMYDITGADEIKRIAPRIRDSALINQVLSQPGAERTVATIVHEATHQLAYNCGMQVRFADNPFWVSEGLAVYFESPDLKDKRGWKTIGVVNHLHLANFRAAVQSRPADSLVSLLSTDQRFREPRQAGNAYSEAWALNYYLLNRRRDEYVTYLKKLAEKKPLFQDSPEERLALFTEIFGELKEFDQQFVTFMLELK